MSKNAAMPFPSESYDELDQLVRGYLDQDMDLIAETVPQAIAAYAQASGHVEIESLKRDIARFRADHAAHLDEGFAERYGAEIDLVQEGRSATAFLEMIEAIARTPEAASDYLHADNRGDYPHLSDLARACRDLPFVSAEARQHGVQGARSTAHAIALHAAKLTADERVAVEEEIRSFAETFGERADDVFSRRFLPLAPRGIANLNAYSAMVGAILASPDGYRVFETDEDAAVRLAQQGQTP